MFYIDEIAGLEKSNFVVLIIILLCFIFIIFFLYLGCTFVDSNHNKILERNGKYKRTLRPGFRLFIPILDKIVGKVDMSNLTFKNISSVYIPTQHQENIDIKYSVVYHIINSKNFYYTSQNFQARFESIISSYILEICIKNNINSPIALYEYDFEQKIKQLELEELGISILSFCFVSVKVKNENVSR